MNKCHTLLFSIFLFGVTQAQNVKLLGTTANGGAYSGGVFFKYTSVGNSLTNKPFYGGPVRPNQQGVIMANDGNYYGMAVNSGNFGNSGGKGCIYKRTPAGLVTVLVYFTGNNGALPFGNLVQANDGNFYGTTQQGGTNNMGVIFKCTLSGTLTVIASCSAASGTYPVGTLIQAHNGLLYGTAQGGGTSGKGTIFKCGLTGGLSVVHSFTGVTDGSTPYGDLVQGLDSLLYAITWDGGTSNKGAVIKSTYTGVVTKLKDLDVNTGYNASGALIQNSIDSLFYGLTYEGGDSLRGTEFKISKTGVFRKIHNFSSLDGTAPNSTLVQDLAGNMYGTVTGWQGNNWYFTGQGGVFKSDTAGTVNMLYACTSFQNGYTALGPLWLNGDTLLYGTFNNGTDMNFGDLFSCSTNGNFRVVFKMGYAATTYGNTPTCTPFLASDGNVYGGAAFGGGFGYGSIYKYDTTANTLSTLASFDNSNGCSISGIMQANDGNFYGLTTSGGDSLGGVIFKCTTTGTITVLKHLHKAIGTGPNLGNLIQATDGNLYGMTTGGGDSLNGVIFKITTAGVYTILKHLDDSITGSNPNGSLVQASDGNLYGMTQNGGDSLRGTLFKITTAGVFTKLASFDGTNYGANPTGSLIQGTDGNLYGMCQQGGTTWEGTIFKSTLTGVMTKIQDLGGNLGSYPYGDLLEASNGNFYGCCLNGGVSGLGTLFKLTPTGTYSVLKHFNLAIGSQPFASVMELPYNPNGIAEQEISFDINVYPNPVTDNLNITFTTSQAPINGEVMLTDITGKRILNVLSTSIENGKTITLDVNALPAGYYLVHVLTNDRRSVMKFIKE